MSSVCPDCGAAISTRGMISHRRGNNCLTASTVRRYEKKGWTHTGFGRKSLLVDAGIPHESGPYRWDKGFKHANAKMSYAIYTYDWAVDVLEKTTGRTPYTPRVLRVKLLRALHEHAGAQKAYRAAMHLGAVLTPELIDTIIGTRGETT